MKRISKIALALLVSGPLLAGCAKNPFATDGSADGSTGGPDGRGFTSAAGGAGGAGGAYGQGSAARPNPREVTNSAHLTQALMPDEPGRLMRVRGGGIGPGLPGSLGAQLARPAQEERGEDRGGAGIELGPLVTDVTRGLGGGDRLLQNRPLGL